ncbi:hypothetical protein [Sphingobacterium faecium]
MDKIIYCWNMVHYYLFVWQEKFYKLVDYINPFTYLFKIKSVKNFYSKHGIDDMNKFVDQKVFNAKDHGINIVFAGINLSGLIVLFEYGVFNIIQISMGKYLIQYIWENHVNQITFIVILLAVPSVLNYYLVFKEEKYLKYFAVFDRLDDDKRFKYGLFCGIFILLVWTFFVVTFCFLPSGIS